MIIITAPVHQILLDTLEEKGFEFIHDPKLNYDSLMEIIDQASGLIVATHIKIDKAMIDKAIKLKWIGRLGSGMEHIDVAYANKKNIDCKSSPEGNRNAVAEFALGLLLSLMRNIHTSSEDVKQLQWQRELNRGEELSGKVVGIIGYGNTGSAFAKLLSAFDVSILAYDKYKKGHGDNKVEESTLENIFKYSNVISLHLPLNAETFHLANNIFFNQFQKKPIFINTSRGGVVDTSALILALENKLIKSAALDVLENENLGTYTDIESNQLNQLQALKNVIITPHIAGYSFEANYKMSKILLEKLGIL
jgi:D-3-phosphoglycerate dehydrogenase